MYRVTCLLTFIVLHLGTNDVAAQDLQLRPLSEIALDDDLDTARYLVRRCAALYLSLANILSYSEAQDAIDEYTRGAESFATAAIRAEMMLGADSEESVRAVRMALEDIQVLITERMRRNMAVSGSYVASDPLLMDDTRLCSEFLSVLGG